MAAVAEQVAAEATMILQRVSLVEGSRNIVAKVGEEMVVVWKEEMKE